MGDHRAFVQVHHIYVDEEGRITCWWPYDPPKTKEKKGRKPAKTPKKQ